MNPQTTQNRMYLGEECRRYRWMRARRGKRPGARASKRGVYGADLCGEGDVRVMRAANITNGRARRRVGDRRVPLEKSSQDETGVRE